MALGLDSAGSDGDVAYVTSALTISFSSSRDVGESEVVADSTTRVEIWLIKGDSRCRARCCRTGDAVGAELVDEGSDRSDAESKVEAQCTAVRPSCSSASIQRIPTETYLWPLDTCAKVLSNHITDLFHNSFRDLDTARQTRQYQCDRKKVVLDLEIGNRSHSCPDVSAFDTSEPSHLVLTSYHRYW
jgi:hypothetical protein